MGALSHLPVSVRRVRHTACAYYFEVDQLVFTQENKVVRVRVVAVRLVPDAPDFSPIAQLERREVDIALKTIVDLRQVKALRQL